MMRRWTREARLSLARLPNLPGLARAPSAPAHIIRDLWPGDAGHGARLIKGHFHFGFRDHKLNLNDWEHVELPGPEREWLHGFTWLRDLRALGSDEARLCARAIVGSWLDHPPTDPLIVDAATTGARLAAWMGHYDFFAASADEVFRQRLMDRLLVEGRTIAALLPLPVQGWRGLTALKGLLAAAVSIPSQSGFLSRFLRYLDQDIDRLLLPDGSLAERSPEAQLQTARELAEMSAILRMAQMPPAPAVIAGLARVCPVLRAMRHADGGLAIFNGASEHPPGFVEMVLQHGARQRLLAPSMPDSGFIRVAAGKSLLFVDGGMPPPHGFDRMAHGGPLSFEFSHGRQRLFVNCGSAPMGAWEHALRATAAHTTLVLDDRSCVDFAADGGLSRRPAHVTARQTAQDGAHWLDLSHDGYRTTLGANWRRRLYLNAEGSDLRGEETVEAEREVPVALRFHLHPDVSAQISDERDEVILHAEENIWRFRHDGGALSLEDSVYTGDGQLRRTAQIIITAPVPPKTAPEIVQDDVVADTTDSLDVLDQAEEAGAEARSDTASSHAETPAPEVPGTDTAAVDRVDESSTKPSLGVTAQAFRQTIHWMLEKVPE